MDIADEKFTLKYWSAAIQGQPFFSQKWSTELNLNIRIYQDIIEH